MKVETFTLLHISSGLYRIKLCVPSDEAFRRSLINIPQVMATIKSPKSRCQMDIRVTPTLMEEELLRLLFPRIDKLVVRRTAPSQVDPKYVLESTDIPQRYVIFFYDKKADKQLIAALKGDRSILHVIDQPTKNRLYFTCREWPMSIDFKKRIECYCACFVARHRP